MNARMRRLTSDYEQIKKNFSNHKYIVVEPIGDVPAEKYRVTYYINGIYLREDGTIETQNKHIVIINLHADYPRYKPVCTIATPIWHPNFRDGQICIGDIWGAGESLSDIIVNIGDMIQYKSWNSFSPLSADAAEWAIEHKHIFPVGNINLWTGEEDNSTQKDVNIEFFDESVSDKTEDEIADIVEKIADTEEIDNAEDEEAVAAESIFVAADDGNDFNISSDELAGIQFVPAAERMQGSRYGATAKGRKVNFKTVLVKGVIWALIGAFVGFGISELTDSNITSHSAAARLSGHSELVEYFEYSDKSDAAFNEAYAEFKAYCRKNGKDVNSSATFESWYSSEASDEANKYFDQYDDYKKDANTELAKVYVSEYNSDEDVLTNSIAVVVRVKTGLWSALIALFIGLFLGFGEGIYYGSKAKAVKYALIGAAVSIFAGAVSGYLAQWMYASMLTDYSSDITKAFVRGLGWAIMGLGVGLAVGLIKPNIKRIACCSIGGVIGAFIGGFLFNYVCDVIPNDVVARGVAIVIMGLLIGVGVGVLEQFAKAAWLKVIRGEFEGKEYLVFNGVTSIGNSGANTIVLFKDKLISPNHCDIVLEGGQYILVDKGSPMGTLVNGMRINRYVLRQGDAIAIGNSVLIFNTK